MDTDPNNDSTGKLSTSDVLSVICFVFTAYLILNFFRPSEDVPVPETSPGGPHMGRQETGDVSSDEQFEDAETERESPEEEKYGMRRIEWEKSFGVGGGRTDIISLCESEESGAGGLSREEEEKDKEEREDEDEDGDGDKDDEDEEHAEPKSSKERGRTWTAYNAPTNPAPSKKQRETKPPRKPPPGLLKYNDAHYALYNPVTQNQGAAIRNPFRHFSQYDDYALYINPNLKETELEEIPHWGVRIDDLIASKVLLHYSQRTLHTRWPAEFDLKGMIRATRVPLGRAAKRWVKRGERDVEGKRAEVEGWYYLSWGGLHTLMGKEGLDADRYWVRPSFESFKCPGLGFKRSDWAEIQMAPEDPADPTFL